MHEAKQVVVEYAPTNFPSRVKSRRQDIGRMRGGRTSAAGNLGIGDVETERETMSLCADRSVVAS